MALFLLSGDEKSVDFSLGHYAQGEGRSGLCVVAEPGRPCYVRVGPLVGGPRPSAFRAGFAVKFTDGPASSDSGFFQVHVYSGGLLRLHVAPGGYVEVRFNKDVLQRSERAFSTGRWYYVELYVRPGPSGSFVVMVDGEEWAAFTGAVSFLPSTPVSDSTIAAFPSPVEGLLLVDDFYFDTDPDSSDWLGDITVVRLPVESVESNSGWDVDVAAGSLSAGDPGDVAEVRFGPVPEGEVRASAVYGLVRAESPGPVGLSVSLPGGVPVSRVPGDSARGLVASVLGDGGPVGRFEVVA